MLVRGEKREIKIGRTVDLQSHSYHRDTGNSVSIGHRIFWNRPKNNLDILLKREREKVRWEGERVRESERERDREREREERERERERGNRRCHYILRNLVFFITVKNAIS